MNAVNDMSWRMRIRRITSVATVTRIYLSSPDIGALEEQFVVDAIRSGWVAPLGPHVDAFEREIADRVGVVTGSR